MTEDIGMGAEPEFGPWEDEHPDTDTIDELRKHCAEMGIRYGDVGAATGSPGLVLYLLCNDNTERAVIADRESLEEFLKVPLDRYKFVAGYQAIYSGRDRLLEAALDYEDPRGFYSQLFGELEVDNAFRRGQSDSLSLRIDAGLDGTVEISPMSEALRLLTQSRGHRERLNGLWMWELNSPSIKIRGYRAEDDMAIPSVLEGMAIDILMQIDVKTGRSAALTPANPINADPLPPFTSDHLIEAPNYVYDLDIFRLYTHAGMIKNSPTIKYLSYYQVIEYYLIRHWRGTKVARILDIFDKYGYSQISEAAESIISLIIEKNGRLMGHEQDLVTQVVEHNVNVDDLRAFLSQHDQMVQYLTHKGDLSSFQLDIKVSDKTLLRAVAKRIYKLRCRIVHSKSPNSETDPDPLFPFSPEVKELKYDLELIRYVARNVLIANRKPR